MAQIRGRRTTVVHLGFVNRPSTARNVEITGKSHGIVKLTVTGKHGLYFLKAQCFPD